MNTKHNAHPGGRLRWHVLIVLAVIVGAFLLAISGATAAKADADTYGEIGYLQVLDSYSISYSSDDAAIDTGYAICDGFRQGLSLSTVIRTGVKATGGFYDQTDVAHIAGAATGALCPGVQVKGVDY